MEIKFIKLAETSTAARLSKGMKKELVQV
jgi:hypothetical protein